MNNLTCEVCGITNEDVVETTCPYMADMFQEEVPATLCDNCYGNRVGDV